jgi:hypothetical protein
MNQAIANLPELLRSLDPVRNRGVYVYSTVPAGAGLNNVAAVAFFREAEGVTVITTEEEAVRAGFPILFRASWITLNVHSDLQAVGLTAAIAQALADAGISCNVVAAVHHDHIFVPYGRADDAFACLKALQENARARGDA